MHLGLDLLLECNLPALKNFLDVGAQLACFGIDDRELLFDPESKCVLLGVHGGKQVSARNSALSSRAKRGTSHVLAEHTSSPVWSMCLCGVPRRLRDSDDTR